MKNDLEKIKKRRVIAKTVVAYNFLLYILVSFIYWDLTKVFKFLCEIGRETIEHRMAVALCLSFWFILISAHSYLLTEEI